ncbi:saccharopine dehydrogenase family protein [Hoeflea prorocentri]|uniref:Saccharopine dehydrogenase NADP-binding domain-containing protein n=1 Tax=Hoeflea prorocentri TaxID=1922333 RepID=A0A9X3UI70_9HYPH|nr:saccharopine dehydrogenase C-terminal domain-containing protein [Hoeflea prorocentri]MCY6381280.1 saccharopine dehydrogenase NADP-binding domain-containing protein [Hoeflea prorocentri]MDA5399080.1 saccharopine dehydrogenase NADP-binding domain-containing protein [Hoeflea prorocentri]
MKEIAVLGLGKVGKLAALLLHDCGFNVTGFDMRTPREAVPYAVENADISDAAVLRGLFGKVDAVLSCLPYHLNIAVADAAHAAGIHYFDLTEDVPTTKHIIELAASSKGLMAPQCGLAPGFVGIVGASQIAEFDKCRSVRMRVGALPQNPTGLMGYSFNWSPEGVVNEYLNDCEVIEGGERKWVSPMEWHETLYIDGVKLEAFTTSGGLGTMCDTYHGTVDNIDYKTMRYPGHMELMNFFFHELLMRERRELAGEILVHAKPPVDHDVVYVHVASEGEIDGRLARKEFVRGYRPLEISGADRTAIAWTTAGSVVAVIEMVRDGILPQCGFLRQEDIPLDAFLRTRTGALYAQ